MTNILAQIFGLYFFTIGLAFIINPNSLRKMCSIAKEECFLFIGALMALLIGIVVVATHNYWVWNWPVLITLLGWWSLIKGFALLTYPDGITFFSFIQNRSNTTYRIISLFYLAIGVFLLYKS